MYFFQRDHRKEASNTLWPMSLQFILHTVATGRVLWSQACKSNTSMDMKHGKNNGRPAELASGNVLESIHLEDLKGNGRITLKCTGK